MTNVKNINIDGTRAYALLKKVVEKKGPDYVTPTVTIESETSGTFLHVRARYTHNGKSLCPVGHALAAAGVRQGEMDVVASAFDLPHVLPSRVKLTYNARMVFREAQRVADDGRPWGEALHEAYKVAPVAHGEK